jgi:hypothetical protein
MASQYNKDRAYLLLSTFRLDGERSIEFINQRLSKHFGEGSKREVRYIKNIKIMIELSDHRS